MMLSLENILEQWKKDSEIDEMNLDEASRTTTRLHAKYLELLSTAKLVLKKRELEQKTQLRDKWLYFNGKMDKSEMDSRGWPYDPFNGLKIMKSDLEYYFNSDTDLQKSEERIIYLKTLVETLEEIINNIRWRHSTIKNMIDWRRFTSGG
jgi:hypothetical protein